MNVKIGSLLHLISNTGASPQTSCALPKSLRKPWAVICVVAIAPIVFASSVESSAARRQEAQGSLGKSAQEESVAKIPEKLSRTKVQLLKKAVQKAFLETHDGYSSDEVILDDALYQPFLAACQTAMPDLDAGHFGWTLMNMRKAGKLEGKVTKRKRRVDTSDYILIAEIAARAIQDKFRVSTDRMMTSPILRQAFDKCALNIDSKIDTYLVRKTAFQLRKKRKLKPELITRIATWGRNVHEFNVKELAANPKQIPEKPGIYIFRDKSGYIYIGESVNLRSRISKHLVESDRKSLANYLKHSGKGDTIVEIHSFDSDSQAKEVSVRRAYESELIHSRKPRLNVRD